MSKSLTKSRKRGLYKQKEFALFIKTIRAGQVGHWVEIAKAIGVSQDTIMDWKKLPEAQEAIKQGIDHALSQMEVSGRKDWRMWNEKAKMLVGREEGGTVNNNLVLILNKYGGAKGGGVEVERFTSAESGSSESSA